MARVLIQVRPGVETGHGKSPWGSRGDVFTNPCWLRPMWEVEEAGFWGLVCRGPKPSSIEALVDASDDLPPLVCRVIGEHERVNIQADTVRGGPARGGQQ